MSKLVCIGLLIAFGAPLTSLRAEDALATVSQTDGLVAFWTFQESAGSVRRPVAGSDDSLHLIEQRGPIERADGGVFGSHCLNVRRGQFLKIPRASVGPLNIHGSDAEVTVIAWVKRDSHTMWQAIAGVWDETRGKRQYCLFTNATKAMPDGGNKRTPVHGRAHGHVSSVGGPTPGYPYCVTYSTGGTELPLKQWVCIAMRYDGFQSSVFVNGHLDHSIHNNPLDHPNGLYDGGSSGADFTVAAVHRKNEWGNFYEGKIGGLAIFNRALTDDVMWNLGQIKASGLP